MVQYISDKEAQELREGAKAKAKLVLDAAEDMLLQPLSTQNLKEVCAAIAFSRRQLGLVGKVGA